MKSIKVPLCKIRHAPKTAVLSLEESFDYTDLCQQSKVSAF